jgi:hypothetical protein
MLESELTRTDLSVFLERLADNDPTSDDPCRLTHFQVSQMIELILRKPDNLTAFEIFSLKLMLQPRCSHAQRRVLATQLLKEIILNNDDEFNSNNDDPF